MTEPWGRLRIAVVDDEIIVSLPGTSYGVTYFKREKLAPAPRKEHLE